MENFKAYAPEDKERYYRFTKMGYHVDRIADGWVYHFRTCKRRELNGLQNPLHAV